MVNVDTIELQHLKSISAAVVLAVTANCLFYIFGFYHFPKRKSQKEERLSILLILKAFIIFLVSPLILIPSISSLWFMAKGLEVSDSLPKYTQTWLHIIGIWLTFILFATFVLLLNSNTRKVVFGTSSAPFRNIFIGCVTWLAAYPTVLLAGNALAYGIYKFFEKDVTDQVVVEKLKASTKHPLQYQLMVLTIILIVPFLEEFLFRGFLQTWIRQHAGKWTAIATTSFLFSFFHYSSLQGITNIQLVASLFILSCYLGFLRERQQSVWAPMGLHAFFNGMSIFFLHAFH